MLVYLASTLFAFLLNLLLTFLVIKSALKFGWFDTLNERKIHSGKIPRLGGVGIFLSTIITFFLFYLIFNSRLNFFTDKNNSYKLLVFFISMVTIFLVGLFDDFNELKARYKLFFQLFVTALLLLVGFQIPAIQIPFTSFVITNPIVLKTISFFWFIGMMNAVNLIDGMDGLSGGTTLFSIITIAVIALFYENTLIAYLAFIIAASLLAFLCYNLPPAKTFMGDCGSLFLGYILATLPLLEDFKPFSSENWILVITIFAAFIPISDTLFAMFRRLIIKHTSFFNPDKEHIHHKLLFLQNNNTQSVLATIYFISLIGCGFAAAIFFLPELRSWLTLWALLVFTIIFVLIHKSFKKATK